MFIAWIKLQHKLFSAHSVFSVVYNVRISIPSVANWHGMSLTTCRSTFLDISALFLLTLCSNCVAYIQFLFIHG